MSAYEIQGIADVDHFQNDLLSACRSTDKLRRPASVHPRLFRMGSWPKRMRGNVVLDLQPAAGVWTLRRRWGAAGARMRLRFQIVP